MFGMFRDPEAFSDEWEEQQEVLRQQAGEFTLDEFHSVCPDGRFTVGQLAKALSKEFGVDYAVCVESAYTYMDYLQDKFG